ncbi:MAG: DUF1761 domain-containing protein [bacterium]|nr:DUF1761 domain-containing protein [bacterium]
MDFDWIAIALSTVVAGGLGAAWYSPALFGPAWMAEIGLDEGDAGPAGREIAGSVFSCFVASLAMAWLLGGLGITGVGPGLLAGAIVGFGIVAMAMLSDALFSGWSARLYLIQVGYRALYLILIGGIQGWFAA